MYLNKNKILFFSAVLFILTILGCFRYLSGFFGLIILFLFFATNTLYLFHFLKTKFFKNIDIASTAILLLCFYIFGLSIIYYIFGLTSYSVAIFVALIALVLIFLYKFFQVKIKIIKFNIKPFFNFWLLLSLGFFLYFFFYFWQHQILDGRPSPWPSLWWIGFILFAIWSALLFYFYFKKQNNWHNFLYLLLANIVVAITHVLSYGYDSLIHQSSLKFIAEHGQITPLSPFYIGQYSLEVLVNFFTRVDFVLIERWFLPLFFMTLVWILGKLILNRVFKEQNLFPLVLSVILLIPDVFSASSPFGFSLLISVIAIAYLYLFIKTEERHFYILSVSTAVASLFIHPFVGLNIILWILYWPYYKKIKNKIWRKISLLLTFILSSTAVVLAFAFYNWLSNKVLVIYNPISYLADFFNIFGDPIWYIRNGYSVLEYIIYFYERTHFFLLLLFVWYFFPLKIFGKYKENLISLVILSSLISAWFFISALSINNYYYGDQVNYSYRLVQVAKWLSWPLFLALIWQMLAWLKKQNKFLIFFITFCLVMLMTGAWYLTYPRQDNISHMSVNSARAIDLEAIEEIYQNENGKDGYLVLANQLFGALAVKQYGFGPYYKDSAEEFLYYSLPWGGQLAKLYNQFMTEENGEIDTYLDKTKSIANSVGLHKFYFIFTDAWAPQNPTAKALELKASQHWQVEDKVFIYKFEF